MSSNHISLEDEKKAETFYKDILKILNKTHTPFIIGGTYAVRYYTEIDRPTKDIDIFCKAGDYPRILKTLQDEGYQIEVLDDRWLSKVTKGEFFADIIYGSVPGTWPITDEWMAKAPKGKVLGYSVNITPAEELIVSKAYRMGRYNFDGADVIHIMLKKGKELDWDRLLNLMEPNWEVLLFHIVLFRFVYPSERDNVPEKIIKELLSRVKNQMELPPPIDKISRGSLLSPNQFKIAYDKWGYKDLTQVIPHDEREK